MLNAATKKTASAPKPPSFWLPLIGLVFIIGIIALIVPPAWRTIQCATNTPEYLNDQQLHIGNDTIKLQLANDSAAWQQGLSGMPCLPNGQGMLFDFHKAGTYSMWMKDMKFSIDMVWVGADKKVVKVESFVRPDSYPQTFANPAGRPARYVIELRYGTAPYYGISPGNTLTF